MWNIVEAIDELYIYTMDMPERKKMENWYFLKANYAWKTLKRLLVHNKRHNWMEPEIQNWWTQNFPQLTDNVIQMGTNSYGLNQNLLFIQVTPNILFK